MNLRTYTSPYHRTVRKKFQTSYILRSTLLQKALLIDSIHQLMRVINSQSHLCIELIHCGFENENHLNDQDRIAIYLIIKAQIKNILKNSSATSATIHLAKNHDKVAIVIEDNGADIDTAKFKNSRAQRTVENLVNYHKGQYNISFDQNNKTVLQVLITVTDLPKQLI